MGNYMDRARSKDNSRHTWDVIKDYVKEKGKWSDFTSLDLRIFGGSDYNGRGLHRLVVRGVIKVVNKKGGKDGRKATYALGQGVLALPLEDILSLDYNRAVTKTLYK